MIVGIVSVAVLLLVAAGPARALEDTPAALASGELDFIFAVLDRHGTSTQCDGCDWTPSVTD